MPASSLDKQPRIAVIGGGIYGCYTAALLSAAGYQVCMFEQNDSLVSGTSGNQAVRLHAGPHYPRSLQTRDQCRAVFRRFHKMFPKLVQPLSDSLYAYGERDVEGLPPRVTLDEFEDVCNECETCERVEMDEFGFSGVLGLWRVYEPVILQDEMRKTFRQMVLKSENVELKLKTKVNKLENSSDGDGVFVDGERFDWAVNCTYFKSFASQNVGGVEVYYQPCVALYYEDMSGAEPFTFTVMDGWFPNLMPVLDKDWKTSKKATRYMLTHAKYTHLGTYSRHEDCLRHARSVDDKYVNAEVRPKMEKHISEFIPGFEDRFRFVGYNVETVTKLRTRSEFRGALVFQTGRILHEFSGKLHEIIKAGEDVLQVVSGVSVR